jgi:hypothetical protein
MSTLDTCFLDNPLRSCDRVSHFFVCDLCEPIADASAVQPLNGIVGRMTESAEALFFFTDGTQSFERIPQHFHSLLSDKFGHGEAPNGRQCT